MVELMVAGVLIVVGALGVMAVFGSVARSIQYGKAKTLASNLCQELQQILKQKNYYRVLVTTAPLFDTNFTPAIPYDNGFFPPETILEGGITFTRYAYVEVAQEVSGDITTLAPTSLDTGLKLLTVTTVWQQSGEFRSTSVKNVLANPDAVMTTSILRGKITNSVTGANIPNATVQVSENTGFIDTTNATGDYVIGLYPGSYNILISAQGYFDKLVGVSVPANTTVNQNVTLNAVSTRTLSGWVWTRDHLVISQIMGSTNSAAPSGMKAEYVEIFNPTTFTWTVSGRLGLKFQSLPWLGAEHDIVIDYSGSPANIVPGGYYLFANTGPIVINGISVTPDAVWDGTLGGANDINFPYFSAAAGAEDFNIIPITTDGIQEGAGSLKLVDTFTGVAIDTVGWRGGGGGFWPPSYEMTPINQMNGLQVNEQFTRLSSTAGVSGTVGRAYDIGYNFYDFWDTSQAGGTIYTPKNTLSAPETVTSGSPAIGGAVSCTDGLSSADTIDWEFFNNGVSDAYAGRFVLNNVATGTWSLYYGLGRLFYQTDNVVVPVGVGNMYFPSATTVPAWTNPGLAHVYLTTTTEEGWILGTVTNVLAGGIAPGIQVTNGVNTAIASSAWPYRYLLRTTPGIYNIRANPGNLNPSYVSSTLDGVVVNIGQITSGADFVLTQGGALNGFVTRDGTNPLPGMAVTATNSAGLVAGNVVSGANGRFSMFNLSTGTYNVEVQTSSGETVLPTVKLSTVTVASNVWTATFTVAGAAGFITGTVSAGGTPIRTGTIIVASTGAIVTPPSLSSTTLAGAGYYLVSSYETGDYRLEVRGSTSTPYNIYGFYPTWNGAAWVTTARSSTTVTVIPGQTKSGVSFVW